MSTSLNSRPFTDAVTDLIRSGLRFQDLEVRSERARSTAWFNKLVNADDPWAVNPPDPAAWDGLQSLLSVGEDQLRDMIAVEWLGRPRDELDVKVRAAADVFARLDEKDQAMLVAVANRLAVPTRTLEDYNAELARTFDDLLRGE